MIVDFSVSNFKSIKDEQCLSMVVQNDFSSHKSNYISIKAGMNLKLLKSGIIYGANASGKSNILNAMLYLQHFIINSTDLKLTQKIPYYEPFFLDTDAINKPVHFEIEFIVDKLTYLYILQFNFEKILIENLYQVNDNKRYTIFERTGQKLIFGTKLKGFKKNLERELLVNNLFLSKAANSNLEQLKEIYLYFLNHIKINTKSNPFKNYFNSESSRNTLYRLIKNPKSSEFKKKFISFLKNADFGINNIDFVVSDINNNYLGINHNHSHQSGSSDEPNHNYKPVFFHKRYSNNVELDSVGFDISLESTGTIKMLEIAAIVIDALDTGKTLIIDEFDSSIHPTMTYYLISLFNSSSNNPNKAQLIFSTHDTSLLRNSNLRNDQIWFTEKDSKGATNLFSLSEFENSELKNCKSLQNWYLTGRFGALPLIGSGSLNE